MYAPNIRPPGSHEVSQLSTVTRKGKNTPNSFRDYGTQKRTMQGRSTKPDLHIELLATAIIHRYEKDTKENEAIIQTHSWLTDPSSLHYVENARDMSLELKGTTYEARPACAMNENLLQTFYGALLPQSNMNGDSNYMMPRRGRKGPHHGRSLRSAGTFLLIGTVRPPTPPSPAEHVP